MNQVIAFLKFAFITSAVILIAVACGGGERDTITSANADGGGAENLEATITSQQATIDAQDDEISDLSEPESDVPSNVPEGAVEAWNKACCSIDHNVEYSFTSSQKAPFPEDGHERWVEVWCIVVDSNVEQINGPTILVKWTDGDWTVASRSIKAGDNTKDRPDGKHRKEWIALGCDVPPGF